MKKALLLAASVAIIANAAAKPVDPSVLIRLAEGFFPGRTLVQTSLSNDVSLFVPADGNGFLVLATDDCVRPVLAFSPSGTFQVADMPSHVAQWIGGYTSEISSVKASGIGQTAQVAAEWSRWLERSEAKTVGDSVGPMLSTAWNQGYGFNMLCPYDTLDSMRTYTGCVATATAQIMNYWQHPATGWGSYAYSHPRYGVLSANFGATNYQWNSMPDTVNSLTPDSAKLAVSVLMYHVGVACGMNYGTSGSGAAVNAYGSSTRPSAENALKTYFKYNPMLYSVFKSEYTDAEWDTMIRAEIDGGRPVLYTGYDASAGHAFVLDGYKEMDDSLHSGLFFHVNWGWGGSYDGYYTTDSLSPGAGGIGGNATYTFNEYNSAVLGIVPAVAMFDSIATISVAPDNYNHGTVSGSGDYRVLQDEATLWARAAEGYRFVRWQSGSLQNPVHFLVNGDITDTAIFEPLSGDTLGYCFDGLYTSWADDYGATTEWGIRIPASMRNPGRQLSGVQFYAYNAGDYTLKVYIGSVISDNALVHTQTVSVPGYNDHSWQNVTLTSPISVSGNATVWVTLSYTGYNAYPAAMSRYSGNSDGTWYHQPEGWVRFDEEGVIYGSWMLRGVFEPRTITINVMPADPNVCSTYGEGTYQGGDQVTIGAVILDPRCTFNHWSDGSPFNPYTFTASDDTLMIAHCDCPGMGIGDADADELVVTVEGRTVGVSVDAEFYDLQGRLVARGRRAAMPAAGVYMVRAAGAARKVVVL